MDYIYDYIIDTQKRQQEQRVTYKITVQPAAEPVTLSEAKLHLKMDDISADDTLITSLITAARQWCERYCNRAFIEQTITQVYDCFPASGDVIRLAVSPVGSITSVQYTDDNGDAQTWDSSNYILDSYTEPCEMSEAYNQTFPNTQDIKNAVTVTYVAGYGNAASDVPAPIKQAMLLMIGHLYMHREDTVSEKRTAAERLLNFWRVTRL